MEKNKAECRRCGCDDVNLFKSNTTGWGRPLCKPCHNGDERTRRKKNDNARKAYARLRQERPELWKQYGHRRQLQKYGLTPESYGTLLRVQDGKCKICRKESTENVAGRLAIDHCHTTGEVRGLLCNKCNSGIGMLNDDPKLVEAALKYLKDFSGED